VLRRLPLQIWIANAGADSAIPPRTDDLARTCLQCFHIIADLYHLHEGGYISRDLWLPSQRGIRRAMRGPVLRREWLAAEAAFNHDVELCRYMRAMIGESHPAEIR
jgi:hypothetical protein